MSKEMSPQLEGNVNVFSNYSIRKVSSPKDDIFAPFREMDRNDFELRNSGVIEVFEKISKKKKFGKVEVESVLDNEKAYAVRVDLIFDDTDYNNGFIEFKNKRIIARATKGGLEISDLYREGDIEFRSMPTSKRKIKKHILRELKEDI